MAITIHERFESRLVTMGNDPTAELRYTVYGTNDDYSARVTVQAGSPVAFDVYLDGSLVLWRDHISVEPIGDELWEGIVRYSRVPATDESTFSFDTGGGTHHITQSLGNVAKYAPPGKTAPDSQGAIGSTPDGVDGVDITVPTYQFSETHYLADSFVTPTYKATLFALTGRVNDDTFKGFEAGEVLFLGAAGSKRGAGDWEITYRFAASPNVTGQTIGDITDIDKKGWEYLWVRYEDFEDTFAKAMVKRPAAVYIEKVYDDGDFGEIGI
ncbi:MAG: hypothetical protein KDA54_00635 [Phycisphaerales bacterium]|nr:hypothetical protein [Phycisphaerales bacterium]